MKHVYDNFLHSDSYYGLEKKKEEKLTIINLCHNFKLMVF